MEQNKLRIEFNGILCGAFYKSQENRLSIMNRIRQVLRCIDTGMDWTQKQEKNEEPNYSKEYADDKIPFLIQRLQKENKISEIDKNYLDRMFVMLSAIEYQESKYRKEIENLVQQEPIWTNFLSKQKGIGALTTGILLHYFGYCEKAKHVSSLWKYAGLHVMQNGCAPKKGDMATEKFNFKLRMFLYRTIGTNFIRNKNEHYEKIYREEKARQTKMIEDKTENAPKSKLHAELRSRRKMQKHFLIDYYLHCLDIRGIPRDVPYSHEHNQTNKKTTQNSEPLDKATQI